MSRQYVRGRELPHTSIVVVNNDINPAAGWFYPEPHEKALAIAGYFAFWRGVTIQP